MSSPLNLLVDAVLLQAEKILTRHFPCGGQAWPTRGQPVDHPVLDEMFHLGREEFRATLMPDPTERPEIFPSFA